MWNNVLYDYENIKICKFGVIVDRIGFSHIMCIFFINVEYFVVKSFGLSLVSDYIISSRRGALVLTGIVGIYGLFCAVKGIKFSKITNHKRMITFTIILMLLTVLVFEDLWIPTLIPILIEVFAILQVLSLVRISKQ